VGALVGRLHAIKDLSSPMKEVADLLTTDAGYVAAVECGRWNGLRHAERLSKPVRGEPAQIPTCASYRA